MLRIVCCCGVLARALPALALAMLLPSVTLADGMVIPRANMPRAKAKYEGSLEERAQEAIIIFHGSDKPGKATEDLILKITVEGSADDFAWVIPFCKEPRVKKADAALFKELHDYVHYRLEPKPEKEKAMGGMGGIGVMGGRRKDVTVLSRKVVGSYDVAVVRENTPGRLNGWLADEGYRRIEDGDDVIEFYRAKGYVFACIKVSDAKLKTNTPADLHPLRFRFTTGGRDGIYFPMKMTGLQKEPFDVNLYVFYRFWLNDKLNQYGYENHGFRRRYRDWDTARCKPNGGKNWTYPLGDPFLRPAADKVPKVAKLLRDLRPGKRYYLTNIWADKLDPAKVRKWDDDLWLFPYYTDRKRVPYDARKDGPAFRLSRRSD